MSVPPDVAVCVLGDELVAGRGDARGIGWVGRVVARTPQESFRLTAYPLAVPGETTVALAARWQTETTPRLPRGGGAAAAQGRLVLGIGHADLRDGVTLARSRLAVANVVDAAHAANLSVLVVGPPPLLPTGPEAAVAEQVPTLSRAVADVCERRRVPFVDTCTPLTGNPDWEAALAASDGRVPAQAGYGLLAYLVLEGGWYDWLGVSPARPSA